jgi:hypothetical protein
MPRLSRVAVFILALFLGLAIWAVPSLLSDQPLPWDSQGPVYAGVLLVVGLILGFLAPGEAMAAVAGLFVGQLVVLLTRVYTNPATRELWLVSTMLLAGYTAVAGGIGAGVGSALRHRLVPVPRTGERRSH